MELALDSLAHRKKLDEVADDGHGPSNGLPLVQHQRSPRRTLRDFTDPNPHTATVQTPETPRSEPVRVRRAPGRRDLFPGREQGLRAAGERVTWVAGLVLAVSAFTGWYAGSGDFSISVIGWHTGLLGKLVFFIGLAVLALVALRETGIDLPAAVPESLVVIALGSAATVLVLIRLISVPGDFLPAEGRGVGIWISLAAAIAVIVAGLLQASEEL